MFPAPGRYALPATPSLSFIALLFLATLPTGLNAQSPADLIRAFVEETGDLTLVGAVESGALGASRQMTFPVQLESGTNYLIVGFCDDDCTDLDLTLLDPGGDEVESDYMVDAEPVLLFSPSAAGRFQVRVDMVSCSIEPCAYAVGVMVRGSGSALFGFGETMNDRMANFRRSFVDDGYSEMGETESGSMTEGQEMRFPVNLRSGVEYKFVGVCDNDCQDLDLVLFGPDGDRLESDLLTDAYPILEVRAEEGGQYRMAVSMVTCTLDPCLYEVATFARGAGIAAGGMEVTGDIVSGATHRGTLASGDAQLREGEYYDEYTLQAEAGQKIIADLRSSDFDTYLIVETPDGTKERNDDHGGESMHSHLEITASSGGTVSILVTSFSAEATGEYVLQIAVVEGGNQ